MRQQLFDLAGALCGQALEHVPQVGKVSWPLMRVECTSRSA
jgi:hypothetical protein